MTENVTNEYTFTIGSKHKQSYYITINESEISWIAENEVQSKLKRKTVRLHDIVGCQCSEESATENDHTASITIVYYPVTKAVIGKKTFRKRNCVQFCSAHLGSYKENLDQIKSFETSVLQHLNISRNDAVDSIPVAKFAKPLLILINPKSGKGTAKKLFREKIEPMLKEANIEYQIIETEWASHATAIVKELNLSQYYGIVTMSGDGLLHEVYQGLMAREDWLSAVKTPIGVLPGGTGNALACSINYAAGEPYRDNLPTHSTFVLLKHNIHPMDLVALDTPDGRRYSFLSVTWGIVADVDIESERFRQLGNARFTIESIARIINLRTYKARLSFLPTHPYTVKGRSKTDVDVVCSQPESGGERLRSASAPTDCSSPSVEENRTDESQRIEGSVNSTENVNNVMQDESHHNSYVGSNQTSTIESLLSLPPLDQRVPSDWVVCEDNFITVCAVYQSHLGPEFMATPNASISDGVISLMIVRAPVSRPQLLSLMLAMEDGSHVDNEAVEIITVKAFRLEPLTSHGNIAVDGESITYGPIQGQILPGLARIMV